VCLRPVKYGNKLYQHVYMHSHKMSAIQSFLLSWHLVAYQNIFITLNWRHCCKMQFILMQNNSKEPCLQAAPEPRRLWNLIPRPCCYYICDGHASSSWSEISYLIYKKCHATYQYAIQISYLVETGSNNSLEILYIYT